MYKYYYDGPVMIFEKCVSNRWRGETVAPTNKKALCNLSYQYKTQNKLCATAKVKLSNKHLLKGEEHYVV